MSPPCPLDFSELAHRPVERIIGEPLVIPPVADDAPEPEETTAKVPTDTPKVPEGEGRWVSYWFVNSTTGQHEQKHSWVVRFSGMLFGAGWYGTEPT